MTIEMTLKIPMEKLSTIKKNKIEAILAGKPCGQVVKIIESYSEEMHYCQVYVYPHREIDVLAARRAEQEKLTK